mmetsp:Transcript_11197/g.20406  ORF Transcript_11197/g.20406 Transcript_11197/m.20406 type:complete len:323 (-) Transcript_11197:374-1342(-)
MVLLACHLRHVLSLHLAAGYLLHNVCDELVDRSLHLLEEYRKIHSLVHAGALLKQGQRPANAIGPSLHMFNLQCALLQSLSSLLMCLKDLLQLSLMLLNLHVYGTVPCSSISIEGEAIRVLLKPLVLFTQCFQSLLSLLCRTLKLFMFNISVEELVHNVHDISKTSDIANVLEAILCCLGPLYLLISDLLQAVASQLFNCVQFAQPSSRCIEGLICSIKCNLMAPLLEPFAALFRSYLGFNCNLHALLCTLARTAFNFNFLLHVIELLCTDGTFSDQAFLLQQLPVCLCTFALQVLIHHNQLLFQYCLLLGDTCQHVLVYLL